MTNNNLQKNTSIFLATVLVTGVIGISSPFTVFAQEYNGDEYEYNWQEQYEYPPDMRYNEPPYVQEYDDNGYEKEYKKYMKEVLKNDDADHDHDDSSNTYIIIRADQKAIASGIKPNVQNCLQINLDALLTSGDEIEDCHNQRDGDSNQSGID
jgi:hypothetical protein